MKYLNSYKSYCNCNNPDEVFDYFISNLTPTNRTWDYFVNWEKVKKNVNQYNIELNILNSLCGSTDIDTDLDKILTKYPQVIKCFPTLLSIRDNAVSIFSIKDNNNFDFEEFNFKVEPSNIDVEHYKKFLKNSGIINFIIDGTLTSIKDYVFGVEVGLDSNGRKNRSGTINQDIVYKLIKPICNELGIKILKEGNQSRIKDEFNIAIPVDKTSRRFDFVLHNPLSNKLVMIETNFYSGGGSKLKSTCGEYIHLQDFLRQNNLDFIWITDGNGWKTTHLPLRETFNHNDYLINLNMIKNGIFKSILNKL